MDGVNFYKTDTDLGKIFSLQHSYKAHISKCGVTRSSKENYFQCNLCSKTFNFKKSLSDHQKKWGGDIKCNEIMKCETCGKTFAFQHNFKIHLTKCSKKVKVKDSLVGQKIKKKRNRKKLYEGIWYDLKTDELGNKKYHCKKCPKVIGFKGTFFNHYTGKHKEKKFKCENCGKTFALNCKLKRHSAGKCSDKPINIDQMVNIELTEEIFKSEKAVQELDPLAV